MIKTDMLIVGAGPCGLFTVFEAGLLKIRCHIIDALPVCGGQLAEIYPKKPIYDIPGFPEIMAQGLIDNLLKQIEPFKPGFTLGERAETLVKLESGFRVVTNRGTEVEAPVIVIAGGLGSFEPRKPNLDRIEEFEDQGVDYMIKNPEKYRNKKIVIAGGGDSALDWTIHLAEIVQELTLVHRRKEFRGAPDSVDKVLDLSRNNRIKLFTSSQVKELHGERKLSAVLIKNEETSTLVNVDYFIPLFGLSPKLGPLANWGLELHRNAIKVNNALDYSTNIEGIYAVGDINHYPGKLKLILCGFHEAAIMCQFAFKKIFPDKKPSFKYTTVAGVNEF